MCLALTSLVGSGTLLSWPLRAAWVLHLPRDLRLSGPESAFFPRSFPFPLPPRLDGARGQCCLCWKQRSSPCGFRQPAPVPSRESGSMQTSSPLLGWQGVPLGVTPPDVIAAPAPFSFLAWHLASHLLLRFAFPTQGSLVKTSLSVQLLVESQPWFICA